jgi:eukaryotic-like serine/threonine-protein kinase
MQEKRPPPSVHATPDDTHEASRPSTDHSPSAVLKTVPQIGPPTVTLPGSGDVPPVAAGYEVLEELGRGGMGVVYKARDLKTGAVVAMKTLRGDVASSRSRFKSEFRTLAGVRHPNLAELHRLNADGADWYLTLEYVDGVDFLAHLRSFPGEDRLRDAFRQLALGVQALHAAGILHRDLKPSNVKVTAAGRVVVLDFGLAAEANPDDLDETPQSVVGTPAFMAPEQAAGEPVSPASDWYAVGVMLFQALTGQLPFRGGGFEVMRRKREADAVRPSTVRPEVPADLDELCAGLLLRDPSSRPVGGQVLARFGAVAEVPTAGPQQPFIGRKEMLAELDEAFAQVRSGRADAVSVYGPSGAGKSTLVQRFLGRAAAAGALVLAGRCYEAEAVPFKALDGVIDALARHLRRLPPAEARAFLPRDIGPMARVFPVLQEVVSVVALIAARPAASTTDAQDLRRRAFDGVRETLARLSDTQPVVVAIDDLQWGDVDSAAMLGALAAPPDPPTVLWVASFRTDALESNSCLTALRDEEGFRDRRKILVAPLTPAESAELAIELGPTLSEPLRERAIQDAGGNPYFLQELIREYASLDPTDEADGLDALLWSRVVRLGDPARRLLAVVAAAGRPIPEGVAGTAAGLRGDDTESFSQLRAERWIRGTGDDAIVAYHDRVREAVLHRLPAEARAGCHRRLAEVLEDMGGADPERLGEHRQAAGQPLRAGPCFLQAADQAANGLAFERAADLFRKAFATGSIAAGDEWDVRRRLAAAIAHAGRGYDAAGEYLRACAVAPPDQREGLRRKAAVLQLTTGHYSEGVATLRGCLTSVGLRYPETTAGTFAALAWAQFRLRIRGVKFRRRPPAEAPAGLSQRVRVCQELITALGASDPLRGFLFATNGLLDALRLGDPVAVGHFLHWQALNQGFVGFDRTAKRYLQSGKECWTEPVGELDLAFHEMCLGILAYCLGNWSDAEVHSEYAMTLFDTAGQPAWWERATALMINVNARYIRGHFATLRPDLNRHIATAKQRADIYTVANLVTFAKPIVDFACGTMNYGEAHIDEVLDQWGREGVQIQHMNALYTKGRLAIFRGEWEAALRLVDRNELQMRRSKLERFQMARVLLAESRLRISLAARDHGQAIASPAFCRRQLRALRRERVAWAIALADSMECGLDYLEGRPAEADSRLAAAEAAFRAVGMDLHAAACRWQIGRLRGDNNAIAEARNWIAGQGIVEPEHIAHNLVPGFLRV